MKTPRFITMIDALVHAAPGGGMAPRSAAPAVICIGVRGEHGFVWWRGELGRRVQTELGEAPDITADVLLMLDAREADALLSGDGLGTGHRLRLSGDRAIFDRFCRCYVASMSTLDLRAWAA